MRRKEKKDTKMEFKKEEKRQVRAQITTRNPNAVRL